MSAAAAPGGSNNNNNNNTAAAPCSTTTWTCLTCTFAGNPSMYLACSVCGEPRQHHHYEESNMSNNNNNNNNKSSSSAQSASTGSRKVPKLDQQQQKKTATLSVKQQQRKPPVVATAPQPPVAPPVPVSVQRVVDDITRRPPTHSASIKNLSDRQYCCVWNVEVFADGHRPDVARTMLARIARHVNPILRARGWRVKRLLESCSTEFLGCCYSNGRNDADAASTNIKLNLRVVPDKHCRQFFSFAQVLKVMLHEITHTSIGLEDIHPPAFYELLTEIKQQYRTCLADGQVALETDTYGCDETIVTKSGQVLTIAESAADHLGPDHVNHDGSSTVLFDEDGSGSSNSNNGADCGVSKQRNKSWGRRQRRWRGGSSGTTSSSSHHGGHNNKKEKRRPLLKGAKMIDGRTKEGKRAKAAKENATPRELAARAAVARALGSAGGISAGSVTSSTAGTSHKRPPPPATVGRTKSSGSSGKIKLSSSSDDSSDNDESGEDDDDDDDDDDLMVLDALNCPCRCCDWDKKFGSTTFLPTSSSSTDNGRGQKRAAEAKQK